MTKQSVLDKATAHFRNRISGDLKSIHVPEWETKVYFKASMTLKEQSKLIELSQQGKTVEALVETLIVKARNEDGTKMFSIADKPVFMNEVDPQVLIRIVGEMSMAADDIATVEDAEKN